MADPTLSVTVHVDPQTFTKTITFSRSVTPAEASTYLFGSPSLSNQLKPIDSVPTGRTDRYHLETRDMATVMALRPEVRDAIVQGSIIRSNGPPPTLPKWLPAHIQDDINNGKLPFGATRYKEFGEWGDIIVWRNPASLQMYQEFPADLSFYERMVDSKRQARILHYVYTQHNKDMQYFVEQKGMSPEDARAELRRINDEVFKLVVMGAAGMLSGGASALALSNAMRASAPQVTSMAQRSPKLASSLQMNIKLIKPVNGKVNVGGGYETPKMTNLNPIKLGSGGPTQGIPNHVRGTMEEMDQIFEPGSVEFLMSSKLRYVDVNWTQATQAAASVMRPGGKVEMNVWCYGGEAAVVKAAFERAGFKSVSVVGDGVGTMVSGVR